jgi:hypothetical protein
MTGYVLRVSLPCNVLTVTHPASPLPPGPDHHADYRSAVLRHYNAALSDGLPHGEALKRTSQALKSAGHPWHYLDQVRTEVSKALGRPRRGAA